MKIKTIIGMVCVGVGAMVAMVASAQIVTPTMPSAMSASIGGSSVTVSWTAPTETSTPMVGYYIYRNGGQVANTAGTTYVDRVTPGSYTYTVAGYDSSGNVYPQSLVSNMVTMISDTTPPSAPSGLTITSVTSSTVALSWAGSTDNVGVAGYYISRNGSRINTPATITGTTYTDSNLLDSVTYTYTVVAYDGAGNLSGGSNSVSVATLPAVFTISAPYNLTATAISTSEIDLAWGPSTDIAGTPMYYLARDGKPFASTTATSYQDIGLPAGTTHWYEVMGFDAAGNGSSQSNSAGTSTFAAPVPIAPVVSPTVSVVPPPAPATGNTSSPNANIPGGTTSVAPITVGLWYGSRGMQVVQLQMMLINQGDLAIGYDTGFYGALTQVAVQKFQCAKSIVCAGSPGSTGWGSVGPHTRAALNALQ